MSTFHFLAERCALLFLLQMESDSCCLVSPVASPSKHLADLWYMHCAFPLKDHPSECPYMGDRDRGV